MLEQYGFLILAAGSLVALSGYVWLLVRVFRRDRTLGVGFILFPPAAVLYAVFRFRQATGPLVLMLGGGTLVGAAFGMSHILSASPDLGPREEVVQGERRITLTGWNRSDYSVLKLKPETVVLQMANPDVNDATLQFLSGLSKLRELDLSESQVTDVGLPTLSKLPALQILRLRKTRITDQGFRDHLAGKVSLLQLDLSETEVASQTLRNWKAENKEQRKYLH